jgi:transcriptional regulator with XRE-family HTH domain
MKAPNLCSIPDLSGLEINDREVLIPMGDAPLKTLRLSHNLTQAELADTCRIHKTMISKWERSKFPPALEQQIKLAFAFNMTLEDLQAYCCWPVTVIPGKTAVANATACSNVA